MLTFGNKVENGGTTPQGILTAEEFNALVKQVNANSQRADGSVSGIIINGETAIPNKDGYIEIKALNDALAKLGNIEDGAQANKIEKIAVNGAVQPIEGKTALLSVPQRVSELTNDAGYVRNRDISAVLTDMQDRIVDLEGREEVSAEQLEKINSVEAGAQVNVLESVIFNGAVLPVVNKEVSINIDLSRKADLDENGKVLASQMPSYVDDVLDAYAEYDMTESGQPINIRLFEDEAKTNPIKPESQKIYLDKESKYQYRWTGTEYATIGAPTVIGEVAGTAYDGSKGKALSDAFNAHASNIDNPHQVTKGQVGLDNVDNTADKDKNVNSAIKDGSGNVISETYATLEALGAAGDIVDGVIESVSALNEFAESAADSINQLSTNKADKSEVASLAETVHGNTSAIETMEETANSISENLSGHTGDYSNPHQVTKSQIGLGNVDNTADKDKNVNSAIKDGDGNVIAETYQTLSTSQQIVTQLESDISNNLNEINTLKSDKANKADLEALSEDVSEHISDLDNPHQVTKGQVGLSNVDNTADKDKPVSSVQQAALDKKADKTTVSALSESVSDNSAAIDALDASISSLSENKADKTALNKLSTDTTTALDKKVDKASGMGLSTNDYTDEDKAKLDGIEANANNYSLPIAGSELGGVKSGGDITVAADGAVSVNDNSHSHYYEKGVFYGELNKTGYVQFCTITFNAADRNEPFSFQLSSRSREGTLTIFPNLSNSVMLSNPQLFWHSEYVESSPVWYKVESNKIVLYWQKSDDYDEMSVTRISVGLYTVKGAIFTWSNTYVASSDGLTNVNKNNHYVNCLSFNASNISGYTIDSLWVDLQAKAGCMGSVYLYKKTSGVGSSITAGWYNYIYVPHRDGVYKSGADDHLFGSIILTPMVLTSPSWVLRVSNSATTITEAVKLTQYNISDISGLQANLDNKLSKTVGYCVTNIATSYWFLIAEYTCTSEWFDLNTTFIASRNFYGGQAILQASIRTNTMGKIEICELKCLSKDNMFPTDCFAIAFKGTAGSKAEFQIWAKCPSQYHSMAIMPIYFGTRTLVSNAKEYWTLRQVNETYSELRADVRADGLFNHPTGFSISLCQVPEYRTLSGVLELTDSNLATYFANGTLTIPNGVTTVIFNTSSVKTVYLVKGTVMKNGYRLTIGGKWQPDTNSDYQGLEGCFPYYVDYHYYGYTGSSLPNINAYSHFADYVYFNGMWFSKMY